MTVALVLSVLIVGFWFWKAPPPEDVGGAVFHGLIGIPLAVIALLTVWLVYFAVT